MLRIKKDDEVIVIAGKDKGKKGKIVKVFPGDDTVVVENINVVKKARKKTEYDPGGFIDMERPIHISNVMLVDKKSGQPTRFGAKIEKNGKKIRVSKKSGEVI